MKLGVPQIFLSRNQIHIPGLVRHNVVGFRPLVVSFLNVHAERLALGFRREGISTNFHYGDLNSFSSIDQIMDVTESPRREPNQCYADNVLVLREWSAIVVFSNDRHL